MFKAREPIVRGVKIYILTLKVQIEESNLKNSGLIFLLQSYFSENFDHSHFQKLSYWCIGI